MSWHGGLLGTLRSTSQAGAQYSFQLVRDHGQSRMEGHGDIVPQTARTKPNVQNFEGLSCMHWQVDKRMEPTGRKGASGRSVDVHARCRAVESCATERCNALPRRSCRDDDRPGPCQPASTPQFRAAENAPLGCPNPEPILTRLPGEFDEGNLTLPTHIVECHFAQLAAGVRRRGDDAVTTQ